jgi:hypothetical protein
MVFGVDTYNKPILDYLNEYYETKKSFIDVASEATPQGRRLSRAVMKQ